MSTNTIVDCNGVGVGGITRMLTEVVRHWPDGERLELVSVPAAWRPPPETAALVEITGRQRGGRSRTIIAATNTLRRVTARAARDGSRQHRVLSMSPSLAIVGSGLPVTTIVHDFAFKLWPHGLPTAVREYRRVSYSTALQRSARLLCVSARTQHDILGLYGVPMTRVQVWHPGSDLSAAKGELPARLAELSQQGRRILLVAGHAAHKGVEIAIEAVSTMPEFALAVLTDGQRIAAFETAARESGAEDRIVFLPRLTDEDYASALAAAAAFVMPSHFEGYGLPAVEALRIGTPTIISPDPALYEATGGAAIRMQTWSVQGLRQAIAEIDRPRTGVPVVGRSWREAVEGLFALLADQPAANAGDLPSASLAHGAGET